MAAMMIGGRRAIVTAPSPTRRRSEPLSHAKVDVAVIQHVTPRSIKQRHNRTPKFDNQDSSCESDASCTVPDLNSSLSDASPLPARDTLSRKGWLMLRGRTKNDWSKRWVVLSAPLLTIARNIESSADNISPIVIDLSHCSSIYPVTTARSYGIEIRDKQTRYVLSAATPGLRDGWVSILSQAVCQAKRDSSRMLGGARSVLSTRSEPARSTQPPTPDADISLPNTVDSDAFEDISDDSGDDVDLQTHTDAGSSTPRRWRSLSPSLRRSPVTQLKHKSLNRHNSPNNTNIDIAQTNESGKSGADDSKQLLKIIEKLRQELDSAHVKLEETDGLNKELLQKTSKGEMDQQELVRLRKNLELAEREMLKNQLEMSTLQEKFKTDSMCSSSKYTNGMNGKLSSSEDESQTQLTKTVINDLRTRTLRAKRMLQTYAMSDTSEEIVQELEEVLEDLDSDDCDVSETVELLSDIETTVEKMVISDVQKKLQASDESKEISKELLSLVFEMLTKIHALSGVGSQLDSENKRMIVEGLNQIREDGPVPEKTLAALKLASQDVLSNLEKSQHWYSATSSTATQTDNTHNEMEQWTTSNLSDLHVQLADKFSEYLHEKYVDLSVRTVLDSQDMEMIWAEATAVELALISEVGNLLQVSGEEGKVFEKCLDLRHVRNLQLMTDHLWIQLDELANQQLFLLKPFDLLASNMYQMITDRLASAEKIRWIPDAVKSRLQFGVEDDTVRQNALMYLGQRLLIADVDGSSIGAETSKSVIKMQLTHVLGCVQSHAQTDIRLIDELVDKGCQNLREAAEKLINEVANRLEHSKMQQPITNNEPQVFNFLSCTLSETVSENLENLIGEENVRQEQINECVEEMIDVKDMNQENVDDYAGILTAGLFAQFCCEEIGKIQQKHAVNLDVVEDEDRLLAAEIIRNAASERTDAINACLLPFTRQLIAETINNCVIGIHACILNAHHQHESQQQQQSQLANHDSNTTVTRGIFTLETADLQRCSSFENVNSEASLRMTLQAEKERCRRLQADLQSMKDLNDQGMKLLRGSHEESMSALRNELLGEIQAVKEHYEEELREEQICTRLAIESVKKAHDAELKKLQEHLEKNPNAQKAPSTNSGQQSSRIYEQMMSEIAQLSEAYSAKCIENSDLEEQLSRQSLVTSKNDLSQAICATRSSQDLPTHISKGNAVQVHSDYLQKQILKKSTYDRRNDARFLSHPTNIHTVLSGQRRCSVPEPMVDKLALGITVAERRKYFEQQMNARH